MQRLIAPLLALAALVAGGYALNIVEIKGLDRLGREALSVVGSAPTATAHAGGAASESIRIATFNIQVFGTTKADKPHVMEILSQVIRRYDIVAIQEIRSLDQTVLPRLVDLVNADGRRYDFVLGPRLGRTSSKEQYAFVYNTASIELDASAVYTVDDPDDLLHRPPLVAGFRARGPPAEQAFTFTLVNIHTDPDEVADELNVLDDVFRAVRRDGRDEDDVILLGDLNAADNRLGELGEIAGLVTAVPGQPTNTRGNKQYDHVLFDSRATAEFTGRAGVLNLMSEFGLSLDEALEVSDHLPVWAEFSVYEGGRPSRLAQQPSAAVQ